MKTLLSGMSPTNSLHLGNYLGALRNWVELQSQYDCFFLAVDLHSLTVRQDPKALREATYFVIAAYIAAGIDPSKCTLFVQSHVPQNSELAWVLNCFTYMGELGRMTQFKDKSSKQGQNIGAGIFNYPVLMAADILLYQSNLVPVGEDQKQHLELTRDLAGRVNTIYGEDTFAMPEPFIPKVGARIMSLQNPEAKMSKSDADVAGAVFLTDTDDQILKKIKRAVTDSGTEILYDESKPGIQNLLTIQAVLSEKSIPSLVAHYQGKTYGQLKVDTAEVVCQKVKPIREEIQSILKDRGELDRILAKGAEKARARASVTLSKVYERIGFVNRQ